MKQLIAAGIIGVSILVGASIIAGSPSQSPDVTVETAVQPTYVCHTVESWQPSVNGTESCEWVYPPPAFKPYFGVQP